MIKEIQIKCEGKEYHDIDELKPLQGKLKSIDEKKFNDLKKSLIDDGLPLGFHIWKDDKSNIFIIDGHHRQLALIALRGEGYFINKIPCTSVIAKTKKEAAKAILISNSHYAKMNQNSLSDFMVDFELNLEEIRNLDLGDIGLDLFDKDDEQKESEEIDLDFKYKIEIDCENEEMQQSLTEELEKRGFKVRVLI